MKLSNLASLDPVHQARGVKGLSGASQGDRAIWAEFQQDWDQHAFESQRQLAALYMAGPSRDKRAYRKLICQRRVLSESASCANA